MNVLYQIKCLYSNLFYSLPISNRLKANVKIHRLVNRYLFTKKEINRAIVDSNIIPSLLNKKKRTYPSLYNELYNSANDIITCYSKLGYDLDITDIMFCFFAWGYSPNEYICYRFYNKNLTERREFISDRESVIYAYNFNSISGINLFMDKWNTYKMYKPFYKRKMICIRNSKDYRAFLIFVNSHHTFVKKNAKESCGRGVELIKTDNRKDNLQSLFRRFIAEIKRTNEAIILEELVVQHERLSCLNASSVNTVRCITLKTKNSIVVPFCFMKIGRNGSFIDNGGAGGLLVGIDEKKGILNTDAIDEFGIVYKQHPDSNIIFKGYKLPAWKQLISICTRMADDCKSANWIGWDMAYTNQGWLVIEGNGVTEVIGPQSTAQKGIRNKFESVIYEMN